MNKFPTEQDTEDELPLERDIRMDEEGPDLSYRDEIRSLQQDAQIEKLNQRFSLLLILVPCLLGAILLFAYFDLKNRLTQVQDTESTERKALSEDVVDRVGSLLEQYKILETSLVKRVAAVEKSSASITDDLNKGKQDIKKLSTSKVDKKALERGLKEQSAESAKTLAVLRDDLEEQKQAVESLNETLRKEVAGIIQAIERIRDEGQKQESAIKDLSTRKLDKGVLEKILQNERESYKAATSLLQKEIVSLKNEILRLQRQLNIAPAPKAEGVSTKEKSTTEASKDTLPPAPDRIVEQEMIE